MASIDLSGGTEYPRFYRVTNEACLNTYSHVWDTFEAMKLRYEEELEVMGLKPVFLQGHGRVHFGGVKFDGPGRPDMEAWCQPDRDHGLRRIRKRLSKKWNEEAQNTHIGYTNTLESLEKEFPEELSTKAFLTHLNVSHDMLVFGGHHAVHDKEANCLYLAINADLEADGVEKISGEEFEVELEKAKKSLKS